MPPGELIGKAADCRCARPVSKTWDLYTRYEHLRERYWQVREQTEYPCPRPVSDPDQRHWWNDLVVDAEQKMELLRLQMWLLRRDLIDRGVPPDEIPYPNH